MPQTRSTHASSPIVIDPTLCIGCALCVKDCPSAHLFIRDGKAQARETGCIECGHCYAICPQHAVIIWGYADDDEPITPMTAIDSATLLAAMKSRRTVRTFDSRPVEQEKVDAILQAGRYCPTAVNAQNVTFTVLGERQDQLEAQCVKMFSRVKSLLSPVVSMLRDVQIDDRYFFKGAPLVIVASSRDKTNAALASSYMELMAESLGLGVLYSGFFVTCARLSGKVRRTLALPAGESVVTCMVIGYPAVRYRRVAPRKPVRERTL